MTVTIFFSIIWFLLSLFNFICAVFGWKVIDKKFQKVKPSGQVDQGVKTVILLIALCNLSIHLIKIYYDYN